MTMATSMAAVVTIVLAVFVNDDDGEAFVDDSRPRRSSVAGFILHFQRLVLIAE